MYMWECGVGQRSFGTLLAYWRYTLYIYTTWLSTWSTFSRISSNMNMMPFWSYWPCYGQTGLLLQNQLSDTIFSHTTNKSMLPYYLMYCIRKISSGSYVCNTCWLPLLSCLLHHAENDRLRLWTLNSTSIRSVIPALIFWPTRTGPTPSGVPVGELMNNPQKDLRCTKTSWA